MKRLLCVFLVLLLLGGCTKGTKSVEPGLVLREKISSGNGCSFDVVITADYGKKVYTFGMHCQADSAGNTTFCVTDPISIANISGRISCEGGALTFDDHVLAFEMMADGQITPVSAPWLLIKALLSGYIRFCEEKKDYKHLVIDDSYEQEAMQVDVYLTKDNVPKQADILWNGRRIITLNVENFQIL